jgi:hypothetical protein
MTYRGRIKNGVVVFDRSVELPEGAEVYVSPAPTEKPAGHRPTPTLLDRLGPIVGAARELPNDMSVNHDHYLYGAPRGDT